MTETSATLTGLESKKLYQIFVVSRNNYGTSLPTSVLMINVTNTGEYLSNRRTVCIMLSTMESSSFMYIVLW